MPFRSKAARIFATCLTAVVASTATPAAGAPANSAETVSLNFANADIGAVIQAVSKITGQNFIVDPRVKGTLNIVTSRPVPTSLTYQLLLSALRLQGYAAIEGQGVTKIVPEADGKLHAAPVVSGHGNASGDRLITHVFSLRNESAAQLVPVIRPLVSPNNTVVAYPGNNTLVVTDYAANIDRIAQIITSIDLPQGGVKIIPLEFASALDLAATVTRLMNEGSTAPNGPQGSDDSQRIAIVADARSNALLVRSDNPSKINTVRQLVASLDKPGAGGNMHVIYLKNAEATKVAQTLRSVISGELATSPVASSGQGFSPAAGVGAANQAGATLPGSSSANSPGLSGGGMIQADPFSNALIIAAPDAIYNNLRKVVDQLDRRRAQVYVEALITEVSTETAAEIGIQWQAGKVGSTTAFGGTNFSSGGSNLVTLAAGLTSSSAPVLPGNGLNLILGGGTVTVGGRSIADLNVLARFLESESKVNILSTPNLITLDNEEAKIVVGRNLPFVTGQYTTNTGGGSSVGNPFQTIERKDVGLTLKVKPQISEGGAIRLQIFQEASSVIDSTAANANGPITNKRSIESTVLIDDGSIIALGGLVEDTYSGGEQKVPVLGDIPVVGSLFRYNTRKRGKTNLIVFLRPVILRDAGSYENLTTSRYQYIIGQQRSVDTQENLLRNEASPPELPPYGMPAPAVPAYRPDSTPDSTDPAPHAVPRPISRDSILTP